MKNRIAFLALFPVAAAIAFSSVARAKQGAPLQEAQSSAEPAQSVWDGVYTQEQASRGEALYAQRCARCHGPDLTGGEIAPALNSGEFKSNWSGLSVDDLFERIKVSMPQDNPGSLSRQQTADIVAFVLSRNGFPAGKTELAREAEVVKTIRFEQSKPAPSPNGVTPAPFTLTISAVTNKVKLGTPVRLNITVKNVSNQDFQYWRDAHGSEFAYEADVKDDKGKAPPDTEFKKANLSDDVPRLGGGGTLTLKPGDSITDVFNVTKLYDLVSPGMYTLQLQRVDIENKTTVKSNTITLTITP